MQKFFTDKTNIFDTKIIITGDDINHIRKVLRKNIGDLLSVTDGEGNIYTVKISGFGKNEMTSEIIEKTAEPESNVKITLYQSLPKADKMEYIIQKCTELGIYKIVPFISKHTVVNIKDQKTESNKVDRWNKIAKEACKQCGRAVIPKVERVCSLREVLERINDNELSILAYEKENSFTLKQVLKTNNFSNVDIIVGPEGGFSEEEVKEFEENGAKIVTLGPRILRTETAGMAMAAIIMYELEA